MPRQYSMKTRAAATAATRARLIEAALDVVEESGVESLTMQAVAEAADVALRTLYNHFTTREDLVAQTMQSLVDDSRAAVRDLAPTGGTPRERLLGFVDAYYVSYERQGIPAGVLLRSQRIPEVEQLVTEVRSWRRKQIAKLLREIEAQGGLRIPVVQATALTYALTAFETWSAMVNDSRLGADAARAVARHALENSVLRDGG